MGESTNLENTNFLSPLNFKFSIKRAPSVNFFIQKVNIPDIETSFPSIPNPLIKMPTLPDQMKYGDLDIVFKVDESLQNYMEIYNWLIALASPEDMDGYARLFQNPEYTGEGLESDISVFILNSSKETIYEVIYKDAFPRRLGGFKFDTTSTSVNYVTSSASFVYTTFDIKKYN